MRTPSKKLTCIALLVLSLPSLSGCASRYGDGIVIAEKKISNKKSPQHHYVEHARAASTTGAIGGALTFGSLSLAIGLSENAPVPMLIWGTAASAAIGAVMIAAIGLTGSALISGSSYIFDKATSHPNTYQYTIKSLKDGSKVTVTQHTALPLNTKVMIFKQNGSYFIR